MAELAAERATESDIADLIEEVEEMKANTGDPEEFLKHDVRFHQAMARAANNKLMSGVMDTVAQLLFHIRRQNVAQANDLEEAIEWHEKIIAAMRKHDPKRAKETLSGHLRAAQSAWAREHRPESNGKVEEAIRPAERRLGVNKALGHSTQLITSRLGVHPVLSDSDLDNQRRVNLRGALHRGFHNLAGFFDLLLRDLEDELVVNLQDHPRLQFFAA